MDTKTALEEHVRTRLEDSFGKAVTMMILASATRSAQCSTLEPDREGFLRLVDAISCDQRVVDMWGKAGAETTLAMWRALV